MIKVAAATIAGAHGLHGLWLRSWLRRSKTSVAIECH